MIFFARFKYAGWAGLGLLFAGAAAGGEVLSLEKLLEEAIRNNPELRGMKQEALEKEAEIGPAGAYEDPMVELEAMNYPVDTLSGNEFGMTGTQLSVKQKIPFPGKLSAKRRVVREQHQARQLQAGSKQLELIRDLKNAYYELYIAQKRLSILAERRNLTRQLIVTTRNKYAVGRSTQAELLGMQIEESNLLNETLAAERIRREKEAGLSALLGKGVDLPLGQPLGISRTPAKMVDLKESDLLAQVARNNPELKSAVAEHAAAERNHSVAKWGYAPDFELTFRYTFRQPNMDDRGVDTASAGIGMSLPIWFLARQSGEVKAAAAGRARAEAVLDQKNLELQRRLVTTLAEAKEAELKLAVIEGSLLPLARQSVISGQGAYTAAKIDYGALLSLVDRRYKAELEYYETQAMRESKIAELESLVGGALGGAQ